MTDDLPLAEPKVAGLCDTLELPAETTQRAKSFARRADREHPINRSPSVTAAAAVYLAALVENDHVTQTAVGEAGGVSVVAIRRAYRELAEYEGYSLKQSTDRDQAATNQSVLRRLLGVIRR